MIHPINPPACGDRMQKILEFQGEVLKFACTPGVTWPDEQSLEAAFGKDKGQWLWKRLWKKAKGGGQAKSDFHLYLDELVEYLQKNPAEGQKIIDAYAADVGFFDHLKDDQFYFSYKSLAEETQKAVKNLMTFFYTGFLLETGFPDAVHGQPKPFDRAAFLEAFESANAELAVCPACDSDRPPKVEDYRLWDADHFLPKSEYPFLSIHPNNLVPLCAYCNRYMKGSRNPIDKDDDAPLTNTFHPYGHPALKEIEVVYSRDAVNAHKVAIIDRAAMPSRRVESMKRVFKLEEHWSDRVGREQGRIISYLSKSARRLKLLNDPLNKQPEKLRELLVEVLESYIEDRERDAGAEAYSLIANSYREYALAHADELDDLLHRHNEYLSK